MIPASQPVTVTVTLGQSRDRAMSRMDAATTDKQTKTAVNYRGSYGAAKCGLCVHGEFDPGENVGACSKVAGTIRYNMVCDLFNSKTAATSDSPTDPA